MKNLWKNYIETYKPSAIIAIVCGGITILLGIIAVISGVCGIKTGSGQITAEIVVTLMVIINLGLHMESFITNFRRYGKRQDNVLAIILVEAGYVAFLIQYFAGGLWNPENMEWRMFAMVFSIYIWVNAAMLASMPIAFARNCGIVAMLTGLLMYIGGQRWSLQTALFIGLCVAVNGYERVRMSILGGKKESK